MCRTALLILTSFLVFTSLGCEREDLHYDDGKEVNQDPPAGSEEDDMLGRVARLLPGEWKGSAKMDFIDNDNQWKHNRYDEVTLSFSPITTRGMEGDGSESDYEGGKRVWKMAFKWQVDTSDVIHLTYADGRRMVSTSYHLDDNVFNARFVSTDQLETDEYSLTRSSQP